MSKSKIHRFENVRVTFLDIQDIIDDISYNPKVFTDMVSRGYNQIFNIITKQLDHDNFEITNIEYRDKQININPNNFSRGLVVWHTVTVTERLSTYDEDSWETFLNDI